MRHRLWSLLICSGLCVAAAGCEDDTGCGTEMRAIVADIDETLTTHNAEWAQQLIGLVDDPAQRPDASTLMSWYADHGYTVFYVTARGDALELPDGRFAREATADWLVAHDYPYAPEQLYLGDGGMVTGEDAVVYKSGVLAELMAEGWVFEYAYGNADSDIEAFLASGIPADRTFLVGRLTEDAEFLAETNVVPVPDDQAYTQHVADHLPTVADMTCD